MLNLEWFTTEQKMAPNSHVASTFKKVDFVKIAED